MYAYHNETLCITGMIIKDHNPDGMISLPLWKKWTRKGAVILQHGGNGRIAMMDFNTVPQKYKPQIVAKYGDPFKTVKNKEFENLIIQDADAQIYFRDYRYDGDKSLPIDRQKEYCLNVSILRACEAQANKRKGFVKSRGGRAKKVWENVSLMVNELDKTKYKHTLPSNFRSLERALQRFKENSYYGVIHKNYGNNNSEKINESAKFWVLSRWADRVKRVANVQQLFMEYNAIAKDKGWKLLEDHQAIHNFLYREDIQEMWWGHRYGELKAKEKFGFQHSTKLPSMRDSLWYSDGTKLNYFYLNSENQIATINVYEVMDAYSEVLLGYCISEKEDYATQYEAYRMAVQFAGHKPYQLGFDNQGGHKKLTTGGFLNKIAHLSIKTTPYNGKSKTIESAFGRFQSQVLKQDWYFTGQNIQAVKLESKANLEFVNANKANLPTLAEIKEKYKQRRNEWNTAPHPATGISRMEMYLNSINPETPKIQLWDMVDLFWVLREKPVMYHAYGLSFVEKKQEYNYTVYGEDRLPNIEWHRANIDKKFFIKFDPQDMSLVMLYEEDTQGNLRFVTEAETKVEIARGKQEQTDFDHQYIANIKKLNDSTRLDRVNKMDGILEEHGMHPEQYGLNTPNVLGLQSSRKSKGKKKTLIPTDFGEMLKEESELVLINKNNNDDELNIYKIM